MKSNYKSFFLSLLQIAFGIFLSLFFVNCETIPSSSNCLDSKNLSFNFSNSDFHFDNDDILVIDDLIFKHSYYRDSLLSGPYLPKEKIIQLEVEGKTAAQKTNTIMYNRILANHLNKSGKYVMLNYPKLIGVGILDIRRKDNAIIHVCGSKKLLRHINLP